MKLKPLTDLTGPINYHRRVLMVRRDHDQRGALVASAYLGTMAGVVCMRDWGSMAIPEPDGYVEPIEIEEDDEPSADD